ncbi:hypothetical protein L3X38_019483 [Prunus dulcis]|uniref:Uncharacterized protein n=1 Tax=Prunus dulcis TaxID=3755 RepID=A0AAD4ZC30_PRUDU|nr:hypothetical protein L3X38_019483 [Prunus dulcis]
MEWKKVRKRGEDDLTKLRFSVPIKGATSYPAKTTYLGCCKPPSNHEQTDRRYRGNFTCFSFRQPKPIRQAARIKKTPTTTNLDNVAATYKISNDKENSGQLWFGRRTKGTLDFFVTALRSSISAKIAVISFITSKISLRSWSLSNSTSNPSGKIGSGSGSGSRWTPCCSGFGSGSRSSFDSGTGTEFSSFLKRFFKKSSLSAFLEVEAEAEAEGSSLDQQSLLEAEVDLLLIVILLVLRKDRGHWSHNQVGLRDTGLASLRGDAVPIPPLKKGLTLGLEVRKEGDDICDNPPSGICSRKTLPFNKPFGSCSILEFKNASVKNSFKSLEKRTKWVNGWVDFGAYWKRQVVGDGANPSSNLKRPIVSWGQLVDMVGDNGILAIGVQFKINPVANLKSAFRAFSITELLHSVLRKEQVIVEKTERRIAIAKGGVNCLNCSSACEVRVDGRWGNPVEGLKGGHANCIVKTGVIPPFFPRNEGGLGLWLINRKASKIVFEGTIEHLCLAIGLGVIGSVMAKLDSLGFEEGRP